MHLHLHVGFADGCGEWVAAIIDGSEILDVGCELTEAAVWSWGRRALHYHAGLTDDYPADMYDRLGSVMVN